MAAKGRSFERAVADWLPEIDASRCLLNCPSARNCTLCADICPDGALVQTEEMLGIDTEACSGCGLCRGACPQHAITIGNEPQICDGLVVFACFRSEINDRFANISCVHGLDLADLAGLHARGVRTVETVTGNCAQCRYGQALSLEKTTGFFNRLLESRGLQPITLRDVSPERFAEHLRQLEAIDAPDPARRGFLTALVGSGRRPDETGKHDGLIAMTAFQSSDDTVPMQIAVPAIDPETCVGCDACVSLCPESCLILLNEPDGISSYEILPELCTGCGVCVEICEHQAITIAFAARGKRTSVALTASNCSSCGSPFHRPNPAEIGSSLCHICLKANHSKKLFQVLE